MRKIINYYANYLHLLKVCAIMVLQFKWAELPLLLLFRGEAMQEKFETIRKNIEPALKKMHIEVTSIKSRKEGTYNFLTIELDKVNGLDLDTVVEATNVINPIIDKLDIIDGSYILDVVSKERGN
jgi:hypothetical protein